MRNYGLHNAFMTRALLAVALVALCVLLPAGCQKKRPVLKRGEPIPEISLMSTSSEMLSIPTDVQGRITMLLFWSQGCTYCKKEMPLIEPIYQKYADRGFAFVAIQVGPDMQAAKRFKSDLSITFPVVVDEDARVKGLYGVSAVPTMYVLDEKGLLKERILGGLGAADIEKMIQDTL